MSAGAFINRGWMVFVCILVVALAAMLVVQAYEFMAQGKVLEQCVQQRQTCVEALYTLSEVPEAGLVPRAGNEAAQQQLKAQVQAIVVPHDGQRR